MTDKDKIREEVERLLNKEWGWRKYRCECYKELLEFIDNLPEEPVSEDLDEAAEKHALQCYSKEASTATLAASKYDFIAGANWKEQQMMKDAVEVPIEEAVPFGSCKWKLCAKLWLDKGVKGDKVKLIIIKEDEKWKE